MLGYRVRDLIGKHSHEIWHHSRGDGSTYPEEECPIYYVCKYGIIRRVKNEVFWKKNGTSFPVAYTCTPILEGGKLLGAVVTFTVVTKRKREEEELRKHRQHLTELAEERTDELRRGRDAERELRHLTDELVRSSADLQQFVYAASHDLQGPLREIAGFVKSLKKRHKGERDAKADELFDLTAGGVKRMQDMIKNLVEYLKIGMKGIKLKPVDFSFAVNKAVLNPKTAIEENGAIVTHDELPTVMADASQINRLFQNLMSNAIKFRSKEALRVHISAERKDNKWVFSVRDNGMGIEPNAIERIFDVFQRLHARGEYPGAGIGLAICKRIVERHGGRIWVESEPGQGSTFFFALPAL
jgi:light-regulated signal transduction histidine kinase (bacteriophytochrome)